MQYFGYQPMYSVLDVEEIIHECSFIIIFVTDQKKKIIKCIHVVFAGWRPLCHSEFLVFK